MRAGLGINELRIDAHMVPVALHRAFEDIAHAQLFADLLGVNVLALEGEGQSRAVLIAEWSSRDLPAGPAPLSGRAPL